VKDSYAQLTTNHYPANHRKNFRTGLIAFPETT